MTIINGTELAKVHQEKLKEELSQMKANRLPKIVSFCNEDDKPSVRYTKMKHDKAVELGIEFEAVNYREITSHQEIKEDVLRFNTDPNVDGIMMQLPLPEALSDFREDILNLINPEKDVDGLTVEGQKIYMPATVKGVMAILNERVTGWENQLVVVVGSSGEVGRPLVETLRKSIDVIEVDKNIGDLNSSLENANIVISATGKHGLIKAEMIRDGVILIDVGLGDFDESCYTKASTYTPVKGGVGPMTVISLMENVVESYKKRVLE